MERNFIPIEKEYDKYRRNNIKGVYWRCDECDETYYQSLETKKNYAIVPKCRKLSKEIRQEVREVKYKKTFRLSKWQEHYLKNCGQFFFIYASPNVGKTYVGLEKVINFMLSHSNVEGALFSTEMEQAYRFSIKQIDNFLPSSFYDVRKTPAGTTYIYFKQTQSRLYIESSRRQMALRGKEYTCLWLIDLDDPEGVFFNEALNRLRDFNDGDKLFIVESNHKNDFYKDLFFEMETIYYTPNVHVNDWKALFSSRKDIRKGFQCYVVAYIDNWFWKQSFLEERRTDLQTETELYMNLALNPDVKYPYLQVGQFTSNQFQALILDNQDVNIFPDVKSEKPNIWEMQNQIKFTGGVDFGYSKEHPTVFVLSMHVKTQKGWWWIKTHRFKFYEERDVNKIKNYLRQRIPFIEKYYLFTECAGQKDLYLPQVSYQIAPYVLTNPSFQNMVPYTKKGKEAKLDIIEKMNFLMSPNISERKFFLDSETIDSNMNAYVQEINLVSLKDINKVGFKKDDTDDADSYENGGVLSSAMFYEMYFGNKV